MSEWDDLGVRGETVAEWEALGLGPFEAALAQGDGYGPAAARHQLESIRRLARSWRRAGMAGPDGLAWHRAGFAAEEAVRWQSAGVDLDTAALRAGRRMRG